MPERRQPPSRLTHRARTRTRWKETATVHVLRWHYGLRLSGLIRTVRLVRLRSLIIVCNHFSLLKMVEDIESVILATSFITFACVYGHWKLDPIYHTFIRCLCFCLLLQVGLLTLIQSLNRGFDDLIWGRRRLVCFNQVHLGSYGWLLAELLLVQRLLYSLPILFQFLQRFLLKLFISFDTLYTFSLLLQLSFIFYPDVWVEFIFGIKILIELIDLLLPAFTILVLLLEICIRSLILPEQNDAIPVK